MSDHNERTILTPSSLNRSAKRVLEERFSKIWVEGEISNLAHPASGHIYFSLKDANAQIRCALFKPRSTWLKFRPQDGDLVLASGKISLYEVRGDYQLIAEHLEPAGEGALRREYERLKAKLDAEGLFAEQRKQPLPAFPKRIGVVTSPSGAALKDVLKVLGRRWPMAPVRIYPTQVQGLTAGPMIASAIQRAARESACDVLIVTRGGGSLEDLWCFNDEAVVRAVADSPIPVVSAVGHEVDFTLVDFAADLRAPTPSAAAEMSTPSAREVRATLSQRRTAMRNRMESGLRERMQSVDWLGRHLRAQHPRNALVRIAQRLEDLRRRMHASADLTLDQRLQRLELLRGTLRYQHPTRPLSEARNKLNQLRKDLIQRNSQLQTTRQERLEHAARTLKLVSPLDLLSRGYAIVENAEDGRLIRRIGDATKGDRVITQLADGSFESIVGKTLGKK